MNIYLTIMTNFYILGALLAIALALVVIAAKKSHHQRQSSMTPVIVFLIGIGIVAVSIGLLAWRKAHEPSHACTLAPLETLSARSCAAFGVEEHGEEKTASMYQLQYQYFVDI
jgi:hypothetical protein